MVIKKLIEKNENDLMSLRKEHKVTVAVPHIALYQRSPIMPRLLRRGRIKIGDDP